MRSPVVNIHYVIVIIIVYDTIITSSRFSGSVDVDRSWIYVPLPRRRVNRGTAPHNVRDCTRAAASATTTEMAAGVKTA